MQTNESGSGEAIDPSASTDCEEKCSNLYYFSRHAPKKELKEHHQKADDLYLVDKNIRHDGPESG